jgi:hypothetical protein
MLDTVWRDCANGPLILLCYEDLAKTGDHAAATTRSNTGWNCRPSKSARRFRRPIDTANRADTRDECHVTNERHEWPPGAKSDERTRSDRSASLLAVFGSSLLRAESERLDRQRDRDRLGRNTSVLGRPQRTPAIACRSERRSSAACRAQSSSARRTENPLGATRIAARIRSKMRQNVSD